MRPLPTQSTLHRTNTTPGSRNTSQETKQPSLFGQPILKLILSLFLAAALFGRFLFVIMLVSGAQLSCCLCYTSHASAGLYARLPGRDEAEVISQQAIRSDNCLLMSQNI